jgi:hypothetical protein
MRANQQRSVCSAAARYFRAPERSILNSTLGTPWHTLSLGRLTSDLTQPRADSRDTGVSRGPLLRVGRQDSVISTNTQIRIMVKFGIFILAAGTFFAGASPTKAETPDPANRFTKHGLPVPGAYFKSKETPPSAAVAASASAKSGAAPKQTAAKATKKQTKPIRYATS